MAAPSGGPCGCPVRIAPSGSAAPVGSTLPGEAEEVAWARPAPPLEKPSPDGGVTRTARLPRRLRRAETATETRSRSALPSPPLTPLPLEAPGATLAGTTHGWAARWQPARPRASPRTKASERPDRRASREEASARRLLHLGASMHSLMILLKLAAFACRYRNGKVSPQPCGRAPAISSPTRTQKLSFSTRTSPRAMRRSLT